MPFQRHVREQAVKPARQPPCAVAEQRDDGGRDYEPDDHDVDQDRQAEAEHLSRSRPTG
jgi:hypothetical protein